MKNLLSPPECGVRKYHLCQTAHGFIAHDRSLYTRLWFTLCYLVPRVLPCRKMGEEPEYEATVILSSHCVTLCYAGSQMDHLIKKSSAPLTLEDPDLKVRESTSLVPRPSGLSSQIESDPAHLAECDKRSHSKHQTLF